VLKKPKTAKTFSQKSAEIFQSVGDDSSISFNDLMLMAAIYLKLFCSCKILL
jgi:hypothetical protein